MKHTKLLTLASCLILSVGLVSCEDIPSTDTGGGDDGSVTETETGTSEDEGGAGEDLGGGSGPSTEISVASVRLSASELSFEYEDIASGVTKTLTASVIGSDGEVMSEEDVSWSSSETSVATVEKGVVTPVGSGIATITAASVTDPSKSAECAVTVAEYVDTNPDPNPDPNPSVTVESVTVTPATLSFAYKEIEEGKTETLSVSITGSDGNEMTEETVTWSTSDDKVAKVEEGVVTPIGSGTALITAASVSDVSKSGSCTVTIAEPIAVTSLEFDKNEYPVVVGELVNYSVNVYPTDAYDPSYSVKIVNESGVEDSSVAKIEDGAIKGVMAGEAYIVATANDGNGATGHAKIVVSKAPISAISLSTYTVTVSEKQAFTVGPSGSDADIKVTVSPDDPADGGWEVVITDDSHLKLSEQADEDGIWTVTALESDATTTIATSITVKATAQGSEVVSNPVTVSIIKAEAEYVSVTTITSDKSEITIKENETFTIGPATSEANGPDIQITITPDGATVSTFTAKVAEGSEALISVSARGEGNIYTITALSGSDNSEATVTVTPDDNTYQGSDLEITVHIEKNESVLTSISVSGTDNLTLETEKSLDLTTKLTVTGKDQYEEDMTVSSWTVELVSSTATDAVLSGTTLTAGYYTGEVTLKVVVEGVESTAFTVTITQGTNHPTGIAFNGTSGAFELKVDDETTGSIDLADYVSVTIAGEGNTGIEVAIASGEGYIVVSGSVVTALAEGTASVTISLSDDTLCKDTLTATFTVAAKNIELASLSLDQETATIYKNGTDDNTITLIATAKGADEETPTDLTYSWSTENSGYVSIPADSTGSSCVVTAVSVGTEKVTVTAIGGGITMTASCDVTVDAYIGDIEVTSDAANDTVKSGDSISFTASISNMSDLTDPSLTWSSTNEDVISVSGVTGLSTGSITVSAVESPTIVTITASATDGSGKSGSVTVTVNPNYPDELTNYTLSFSFNGSVPDGQQLKIVGDWTSGQTAGEWDLTSVESLTSGANSTYTYTFGSIAKGETINYAILIGYTSSDAPWYTQRIIYEGTLVTAPSNNGYSLSDYTGVTEPISTGVNVSNALNSSVGVDEEKPAEYIDYTVALQNTGEMTYEEWLTDDDTTNGSDGTKAFYIDRTGDDVKTGADGNYYAQNVMLVYEGSSYDYDLYFNFGSTYGATNDNLGFIVGADVWEDDLQKFGLEPTAGLKEKLGNDAADGVPFLKYTTFTNSSGEDNGNKWTWDAWVFSFWDGFGNSNGTSSIFSYIEDFTVVLELDFSKVIFESWSADVVVTGIYYIVNGNAVGGVSCPVES